MNKNYPYYPVNTLEQETIFVSLYTQRDKDQDWMVCLKPLEQDRSDAQRALDWVWNAQIAKESDDNYSANYIHGLTKMIYLLPLYKTWGDERRKRAEFVDSVLRQIVEYSHKVGTAYDMVRTKNLPIKQMAEYLTLKQNKYAELGIILESNDDLEFKSLMKSAKEAKQ